MSAFKLEDSGVFYSASAPGIIGLLTSGTEDRNGTGVEITSIYFIQKLD